MEITTLGIDLAKNVFQIHGVDKRGKVLVSRALSRGQIKTFMSNLRPCLVGIEACGGSNYWARQFKKFGHDVRMMAPQFVKPYVKTNKSDRADAEAICEAVGRPNMRFVSPKDIWQQDIQSLHRVRQRLVVSRTALSNEIRSFLHEYGIVSAKTFAALKKTIAVVLEDGENELTPITRRMILRLYEEFLYLDREINHYEKEIKAIHQSNETSQRLEGVIGVGVLTATAVVAAVGDPGVFKNGRQFAAWLGLVPRHEGSGGKIVLKGISKRGDSYLRSLLIHGARSALKMAGQKEDRLSVWAIKKKESRGFNKACIALANKNARILWAMMQYKTEYKVA